MKSFSFACLTAVFVLFASFASFASAQDKPVAAESQRKLSSLFATLGDKTCSKVSDAEAWECSYRGHGLRTISVRAFLVREDVINADVVMVISTFALLTDFPATTDFLHRLLKFNTDIDFAKLTVLGDGRIALVAVTPLRLLDKEELTFMLDQVGAANNSAFDAFQKDVIK